MKWQIVRQIARLAITISPVLAIISAAQAQQIFSTEAAIIQYVQGEVFLDSRRLQLSRGGYLQMEKGQSLSTKQGLAELLLPSQAYLRLGENGSLRMQRTQLNDTRLALEHGSALIEVVQRIKGNQMRIYISTGAVEIEKAGLYRIDGDSGELRVYGGEAVAASGGRKATFRSGRMVHLTGDLTSEDFDMDAADSLHRWAAQRSFGLYIVTPDTRKQTHWAPISLGWVRNSNYRMSFYSELFYQQWIRNQAIQRLEELLTRFKLEEDISGRTIYGAEREELVAKILEAQRAIKAAEERAKQADPATLQAEPDGGKTGGGVPRVPEHYAAAPKGS